MVSNQKPSFKEVEKIWEKFKKERENVDTSGCDFNPFFIPVEEMPLSFIFACAFDIGFDIGWDKCETFHH